MRTSALAFAGFVLLGSLAACASSYSEAPASGGGAGGDDGGSASDAGAPCGPPTCALPAAGDGFALALFGERTDPCPAGFATAETVEDPTAPPDTCACGACSMQGTSCAKGDLATFLDTGSGNCGLTGQVIPANDGACTNIDAQLGQNGKVTAPTAVAGSCTAPGVAAREKVTARSVRLCTRRTACDADLCAVPPSFAACLVKDGETECPPSAPRRHVVGSDVAVTCDACACTTNATCGGSVTFYTAANCTGTAKTVSAGVCTPVGGGAIKSYKWTGTIASQACAIEPPPAPKLGLAEPRTVCCP